jgi:hypothetical protein
VKVGDLILWHWNYSIALVISVDTEKNWCHENFWVCLFEDGEITNDDLSDGYTVIDEDFDWPEWHINHRENR